MLETFVAIELTKQLTCSETAANLYHFHQGFVVYQGRDVLPFGENMWAIPFTKLWS